MNIKERIIGQDTGSKEITKSKICLPAGKVQIKKPL